MCVAASKAASGKDATLELLKFEVLLLPIADLVVAAVRRDGRRGTSVILSLREEELYDTIPPAISARSGVTCTDRGLETGLYKTLDVRNR